MNRTRAAAVAAVLAVVVVVALPTTAQADETCANAWLVKRDGSRQYLPVIGAGGVCHETGWTVLWDGGTEPTTTWLPGPYVGAGVEVWITSPA